MPDVKSIRDMLNCTLLAPLIVESPVSCSGLSALKEPDLIDTFSEELGDGSRSITELLFTGDTGIGLEK